MTTSAPSSAPRLGYRDRLRIRYDDAVEQRIAKARDAVDLLGCTEPVPWDEIRAAYERPDRSPLRSYRTVLTQGIGAGVVVFVFLYICIAGLAAASIDTSEAQQGSQAVAARLQEAGSVSLPTLVLLGCTAAITIGTWSTVKSRREALLKGFVPVDDDGVINQALEVLPVLAEVHAAPAGRSRVKAIEAAHQRTKDLMEEVISSSRSRGGMRDAYAADTGRLSEHGRKVRAALKNALGGLVEDRQQSAVELARLTVTIAARQAQAAYGALLDPADLPADPGPDVEDGRSLSRVFTGAALAAGAGLGVCLFAGIEGASLLFVPLVVFIIAAVLVASFSGRLGQLGRIFSLFNRHGGDAS
ncbi:hypothetical protein [Streptomyces hydrogenans]|uniref:hypothetical protein n=1 Tax=Streptomyces hydrogenans TaxID=1873719 RepID=UPI0038226B33